VHSQSQYVGQRLSPQARARTRKHKTHPPTHPPTNTHTHTFTHTLTRAHTRAHARAHTHTHTHTYPCTHTYNTRTTHTPSNLFNMQRDVVTVSSTRSKGTKEHLLTALPRSCAHGIPTQTRCPRYLDPGMAGLGEQVHHHIPSPST